MKRLLPIAVAIAVGLAFACSGLVSDELSPEERGLLVTAAALGEQGAGITVDPDREEWSKWSYRSGAMRLAYTYEATRDDGFALMSAVETCAPDDVDCRETFLRNDPTSKTHQAFVRMMELSSLPKDDLLSWDQRHTCAQLVEGRTVRGGMCAALRGRAVYWVLATGLSMEEAGAMDKLMLPYLGKLDALHLPEP